MGRVAVKVGLSSVTGLPEDEFVHDFEFRWDGPTAPSQGNLESLADIVQAFYLDTPTGGTAAMAGYLSGEVARGATDARIVIYTADDLSDPLGTPELSQSLDLPAFSGTAYSLPAEVAACLSYNADLEDVPETSGITRPAARRRGRLFFGPLNWVVLSQGAGEVGVQRPDAEFLTNMRLAALELYDAAAQIMTLEAGLFWSVFSSADEAMRSIVNFWTDDAFDTQRRRGAAATTRVNSPVP